MKIIRFLGVLLLLIPCVSSVAGASNFQDASKLLVAARRGDIQTVQVLINSGVDVNYVDSTGLSLVCTAVMNNDKRAIQVLQMYGADASECDKQIKQYQQKTRVAAKGEEYGFFSGLSPAHVVVLSAVGVAVVLGGVVLLTDVFDKDNNNGGGGSSGDRPNNNGGSGSTTSAKLLFTVPYGPAYLTSSGTVDTNFNVANNLYTWDTGSHAPYFNYLRATTSAPNFLTDGLNARLQNYLLMMGGYYSLASGYMGQKIFRDTSTHAPILSGTTYQKAPINVALITGNGISPTGSAGFGNGITYVASTADGALPQHTDKYVNNNLIVNVVDGVAEYSHQEKTGFDLSGSGSAFNPFANVNESALAKIVAGWEAGGNPVPDLYGFVPNGALAIYRTGNGVFWSTQDAPTDPSDERFVGSVSGTYSGTLTAGDTIVVNGNTYNLVEGPLDNVLIADCVDDDSGCTNFSMYLGVYDATNTTNLGVAWYVNTDSDSSVDTVYQITTDGQIYVAKTETSVPYYNFQAMSNAVGVSDVVANTNVLTASRDNNYTTVDTFTKDAFVHDVSDLDQFYVDKINTVYGGQQGGVANTLFMSYSNNKPMLVMPAGEFLYIDSSNNVYLDTQSAMFENYAPLLSYGGNLNHNFMTVVGVSHNEGTSSASTIAEYGNGTGTAYGKLNLSLWQDSTGNTYMSRMCGGAGLGNSSAGIDPWCFAAAGPTSEMAVASAAGAVASVKSAFDYMSNSQVFTLLALTADGPYLKTNTDGTVFTTETLATYLQGMYDMPIEYDIGTMTTSEYLNLFKTVYGYGLINLQRAINPGFSVYYYDGNSNNIVSSAGNRFWGKLSSSTSRASTVFSLTSRGAITTSFYDVVESADGSISLPRVWNQTFADNGARHSLYMGDVLADFNVGSTNKNTNQVGNFTFDMAMTQRAYDDGLNGLDNLRVKFSNEKYDIDAQYQRYLTDGESRFSGRANGVLSLVANSVSTDAKYKFGNFAFGGRAFSGAITEEGLLETDPAISSQFEPGRLGLANGAAMNAGYNKDSFGVNVALGNLHETNTVLGMYSDGVLTMQGGDTKYVDLYAEYKPLENVKLSLRGTFADTRVDTFGGVISDVSSIKSNAFAFGTDVGGFSFSAAMPLAVVDGQMAYGYAEFETVENDGTYEIAINNPHTEYVDLTAAKRELRFSSSYKRALGEFTDAGIGFIYRVNPGNTNAFGNESIFMLKMHHRLGI